jgi:hypothetical protein
MTACAPEDGAALAVRGARVVVRTEAPFAQSTDFPQRVESTIEAALSYWGGSWEHLAGKNLYFEGASHVRCGDVDGAIGCYDGDIHVSTEDAGRTVRCVEETVLVHEIGHAIIGDPDHRDPRWMDFSALNRDLEGRPGYGADGEGTCRIYVSMWRHPPRA